MIQAHERITIRQIAAEVTVRHVDTEENRDLIRDEFNAEVLAAIDTGELVEPVPTVQELRASWAWQEASNGARVMGARIRKALSRGESMLDFDDEYLDIMIVVCDKRRTTLRLLTADDLELMAAESAANRRKIDQADDELQAGIAAFMPSLRLYGNFDEYLQRLGKSAS